jgi:rhamnulokinase
LVVSALAFDLGASSGRAVVGRLDGDLLTITNTHRFPNEPVFIHKRMYWDILRLLYEIKQGLLTTRLQGYTNISSVGIDTWGIDFGLLSANGELLGNPYHYRDHQTQGIMEQVWQLVPHAEIFAQTGLQFLPFNTLYQIYAMQKAHSPLLSQAKHLLLIPELLRYFLTGDMLSEWSVASTTQMCNPHTRTWNTPLLTRLGLPTHFLSQPVPPGTFAGKLLPSISMEASLPELPVIAVAEHDTASAVVAVPADQTDFAYLSSGTWSLLGTELSAPLINEQALELNITNEGGINGTTRLLKNVTGLWLIQECRRAWRNEGQTFTYADENLLTTQAEPFRSFIHPDHEMFLNPPHMPKQIQIYCRETGQPVPETTGALLRCILDSLALRYRFVLQRIERLTGKHFTGLHIVGGGTQNELLCQATANALGRPAWAGPQEATAIGNLLVQFIALDAIPNLAHARQIVRRSFPITTYEPQDSEVWEQAYHKFCQVTGQQ